MDPLTKRGFLRIIKFEPELFLRIITGNLEFMCTEHAKRTGKKAKVFIPNDLKELLEALREHFAEKLAEITA